MWISRKKLNKKIQELEEKQSTTEKLLEEVKKHDKYLEFKLSEYNEKFPFELGQTVYDLQLRSASGRFTKSKPSREHSIINEVVVDKKNYFKLVDRFYSNDVFKRLIDAESYLEAVCVE